MLHNPHNRSSLNDFDPNHSTERSPAPTEVTVASSRRVIRQNIKIKRLEATATKKSPPLGAKISTAWDTSLNRLPHTPSTPITTGGNVFEFGWDEVSQLIGQMSACESALRKRLSLVVADQELSSNELLVLRACWQPGSLTGQRELSNRVGVSTAQISAIVERLRSIGLISGHRPPSDRRRQVWSITEKGQQCLHSLEPSCLALALNQGGDFSSQQAALLATLLERFRALLDVQSNSSASPKAPARKEMAA